MNIEKINTIICVNQRDINYLFLYSFKSLIKNFPILGDIYLITNSVKSLKQKIESIYKNENVNLIDENELLTKYELLLDGWYKQQIIKLRFSEICPHPYYATLGADTIILKPLTNNQLFDENGKPILYYNRYFEICSHLEYERKRVESISNILKVNPYRSFLLADFIFDFFIFDKKIVQKLIRYLNNLYGDAFFSSILNKYKPTKSNRYLFGEWTLYSVFLLDILKEKITVKNSNSKYLRQIHNNRVLKEFYFDSFIVHFVDKNLNLSLIKKKLREIGI